MLTFCNNSTMHDHVTIYYEATLSLNDTLLNEEEILFGRQDKAMLISYYVFSTLGIPGNIMTVLVMLSSVKLRQKPINIILVHQAIIDCIVCTVTLLEEFMGEYGTQFLSKPFVCNYVASKMLSATTMYASSYNILLLSIERCYAIIKPLQYDGASVRKRLPYLFAVDWCFSILVMSVAPATSVLIGETCYPAYKLLISNYVQHYSIYEMSFGILVPFVISFICYAAMFRALSQSTKFSGGDTQSGNLHKRRLSQINIFKTCLVVVIVFVICWSIPESALLLKSMDVYTTLNNTHFSLGRVAVILNSCLNPYIYVVRYDDFKVQLRSLLNISKGTVK